MKEIRITKNSIDRLLSELRLWNEKAFTLTSTMYKGFQSNGTTIIIELYERD